MKLQWIFIFALIITVSIRVLLSIFFAPQLEAGQALTTTTTLLTDPVINGRFEHFTVWYSTGVGAVPVSVTVLSSQALHYGQTITLSGKLQEMTFSASTHGNGVISAKKPMLAMYLPKIEARKVKINAVLSIGFALRQKMQEFYENIFSQESSSLLLGIVLGVKGSFGKDFQEALQLAGVTHVIAASGMNVAMVSGFFTEIFSHFLKRQWAIVLTISLVCFYCLASGLQPSIVRATLMLGFMLLGQLFGRQYAGIYGLFLAASGMLLFTPTLLWDVGFQLSFASTLGILFVKPLIPDMPLVGEDLSTTISAQLASLPILLGTFGNYGVLSIVVNALVLWTIPPLMVFGGVGGLVGLLIAPIGKLVVLLCLPLLWYFEKIVLFFGSLHWQVSIAQFPLIMTIGYYLVLGSMLLFFWKRKTRIY